MHIEPGVVEGAKLFLSYATGAASVAVAGKLALGSIRDDGGAARFLGRTALASALVFSFFEVLPHMPVGVSEVHLILGSTLFLIFGAGPAVMALILGLLTQSLFFAPTDLPQFGMNVTTLVMSLVALREIARRVIPANTTYVDLGYGQVVRLSLVFQSVTVSWVAFWVVLGQGISVATFGHIATFGIAYMAVVLVEPLIDLAVLATAKNLRDTSAKGWFTTRLFAPSMA